MKKILVIMVCSFVSLFVTPPVHAQSIGLTISPPVVEILLAPNKKVVQTFLVGNQGENTTIVAEIHAFVPTDNAGHGTINPLPLCGSNVTSSCDTATAKTLPLVVTLGSGDWDTPIALPSGATVPLTVTIESASVTDNTDSYLALVVKAVGSTTGMVTTTTPGISALILSTVTPSGAFPVHIEIADFSPPLLMDSTSTLTVSAQEKNTADVMVHVGGSFTVLAANGKTVSETTLYPNLVLKSSNRIIQGEKTGSQPTPTSLTWHPGWKAIGPYQLRLTLTTVGGTTLNEVDKTVWVLPIRALIAVALLALIVITVLIRLRAQKKSNSREI